MMVGKRSSRSRLGLHKSLLALLALTSSVCSYRHEHTADPIVSLQNGSSIVGIIDPSYPSVRQFLGIPYAAPPLDTLRWRPPQSFVPRGNISAKAIPKSCMQSPPTPGTLLFTYDAPEFLVDGINYTKPIIGEDCLTLSIWTPRGAEKNASAKFPVIVFFHGGRFQTGSQAVPYQIPTQWVERSKDLIVVTFNYRPNIWGFPYAAGLERQNIGLLDQRAAIEWVHGNVNAFGGDPTRITLWGQSAGAMSVDFYNFAWASDPLATGLIMDSGAALTVAQAADPSHASFTTIAKQVGCSGLSAMAELECMQKIPAASIQDAVSKARATASFWPTVDDTIIFADYKQRAVSGNLSQLPAIMGTNKNEAAFMAPDSANGPGNASLQSGTLSFFCPSLATSINRAASGRKTFRYLYSGNFTNISPKYWEGAYHCSELPLLFGTHPNFRGNSTQYEYELSAAMQDTWLAFAKDPDGFESSKYGWAPYTSGAKTVRAFGANNTVWAIQKGEGEESCANYPGTHECCLDLYPIRDKSLDGADWDYLNGKANDYNDSNDWSGTQTCAASYRAHWLFPNTLSAAATNATIQ